MKKKATPKYKIGENVLGRIITEINPFTDQITGQIRFQYGYRYENEPENIGSLYCVDSTLYVYSRKRKR